ncbi:MAG: hypothetical protein U0237_17335 [Thermoleophilia bacterium]
MRTPKAAVAGPLVALGLLVAGTAQAAAAPDPAATLSVTQPVQVTLQNKETPIPTGGTSYYCAVGTFVPFNDLAGWRPVSASFLVDGRPATMRIGDPPYSDAEEINGLVFAPVGAQHHVQYRSFSYAQGGNPGVNDTCTRVRDSANARYGDTATVTYARTTACAAAIRGLTAAKAAVQRAQQRVKRTAGRARAAAVVALRKAKARLAKATRVYNAECR